jgi:putative colanic acid biosynthesis acetyltransferase WcaF
MYEGKTKLDKYDNRWYRPGSWLKRMLWHVASRLFINTYFPYPMSFKCIVLKAFGTKLGKGVVIKPKVNIKYPWYLTVENDTWIGEKVWIDNLAEVRIGQNVCLSQGAMLLTGNHNYRAPTFDLVLGPIILEDGVWIGAQAIVCPGVKCGSHAVLTVNSVATQPLEPYGIYQGNPAVFIKTRQINPA